MANFRFFMTREEGGLANFWFWRWEGGFWTPPFMADYISVEPLTRQGVRGGGLDPQYFVWHHMWQPYTSIIYIEKLTCGYVNHFPIFLKFYLPIGFYNIAGNPDNILLFLFIFHVFPSALFCYFFWLKYITDRWSELVAVRTFFNLKKRRKINLVEGRVYDVLYLILI